MSGVDISFILKVLAKNPPSILMVVGALLMIYGSATGDQTLVARGWSAIQWGVILQILWLAFRYGLIKAIIDALK